MTGSSTRSTRRADRDPSAGARAEALAARFLKRHGLAIIGRNLRTRFGAIEGIARDRETLVFVAVRLRRSASFGDAAESITAAKRARLIAAGRS